VAAPPRGPEVVARARLAKAETIALFCNGREDQQPATVTRLTAGDVAE